MDLVCVSSPRVLCLLSLHRITSRIVQVMFRKPALEANTDAEDEAFKEMDDLIYSEEASRVMGWMVAAGRNLTECRADIKAYEDKLNGICSSRITKNWAILLFFLEKVLQMQVLLNGLPLNGVSITIAFCFILAPC